MKKLLFLSLFLFVLPLAAVYWWNSATGPVSTNTSYKSFLITKGNSAAQIGNRLYQEGFIKSPFAFKFYVQLVDKAGHIQAGEYSLPPNISLFSLVELLNKGPVEVWVTIPEGLTRAEIAQKFAQSFGAGEGFTDDFLNRSQDSEGYLFPDTYLFPKTASASAVISKMTKTFDKKAGTAITRAQIIMASVLEEETKTNVERPIVAGILYKRLENGWPLQVDTAPETYKKQGLPTNPISNPGLSSINASVNPEDSAYWFYLHDEKGNIHYAKTIEEHNLNIAKYLTR